MLSSIFLSSILRTYHQGFTIKGFQLLRPSSSECALRIWLAWMCFTAKCHRNLLQWQWWRLTDRCSNSHQCFFGLMYVFAFILGGSAPTAPKTAPICPRPPRFEMRHGDADLVQLLDESVPPADLGKVSIFAQPLAKHNAEVGVSKFMLMYVNVCYVFGSITFCSLFPSGGQSK